MLGFVFYAGLKKIDNFQLWGHAQIAQKKLTLGMDEGWCKDSQTMVFETLLASSPYKRSHSLYFLTIFIEKAIAALENGSVKFCKWS